MFYGALGEILKWALIFLKNQNPPKKLTKPHTKPTRKSSTKINITIFIFYFLNPYLIDTLI
jgi:hypothetical protein